MAALEISDPTSIGPYKLISRLGAGATGIVFEGIHLDGRRAAIKVIRRELADLPQVRERLQREAQSLRRVSSERCAEVYEVDSEGETPYLAMELIPGQDLSAEIGLQGPLRGAMSRTVFSALVEALEAIHSAGIIHRDLKPSNVLIGESGIRVVDFGISAIHDVAHLTSTGVVVGTAAWMSPEQIEGKDLTTASDVFNLGLVMAFALTGKHPFGEGRPDAVMYRIMHSEPDLNVIPSEYRTIIEKCLEKLPQARPALREIGFALASGSGSNDSSIAAGTTVLAPEMLRQVVGSENQSEKERSTSEPVKGHDEKKKFNRMLLAGMLVSIIAIVGVGIGVSSGEENAVASTTTEASTTTSVAITPEFKLWRDKGKAHRWNPCGGAINVSINYGELSVSEREMATTAFNQAISEVSEISGLPLLSSGTTDRIPRKVYRQGRNGSEGIVRALLPPGKGIITVEDGWYLDYSMSITGYSGSWIEIESVDMQLNSSRVSSPADYLQAMRTALLASIGLTWVDSRYEIMTGGRASVRDFGPGDVQGMIAVGKSQGCIN
jgi:serine/threonine protein kinase